MSIHVPTVALDSEVLSHWAAYAIAQHAAREAIVNGHQN
ncbi:hypothetical protein BDK63_000001 [Halomonas campaniensis]|uniref:Uncharacterized protein n=1 Tax=Halomonas campaniensis TaxID=213554 RepID=A0A7W5P919_9GAMM|nr:hypothetical protein [Halomonas campaniensis]